MQFEEDRQSGSTIEIAELTRQDRWIVEVQDEGEARRFPLTFGKTIFGTSQRADVVLEDATVSARHCALSPLGTGLVVEDLGSTNGTFIGNARVKEAWARPGATVTIGRTTLVVRSVDASEDDGGPLVKPLDGVAGGSTVMLRVAAQVRRLANHVAPVLVSGESGTGKELIARALHQEGGRASRPFIAINVAALPRDLVESEMFGHERGAFTGAHSRRTGAFAEAEGGSLFLDEVGELPLDAQPKLLRALDGYEVRRVGAAGSGRSANVRVIAATHVPLEERVAAGRFRLDLFHRLEVFVIEVPPLRARRGDIAVIARKLLVQISREVGVRELSSSALARLATHDWPGNVRELRNVLYRSADRVRERGVIEASHVEDAIGGKDRQRAAALTPSIAKALFREHQENLSAAARAASVPRTSFRRLLKE